MNNIKIVELLIKSAFETQMQINFKRIKEGKRLDVYKKPYNMELLKNMIEFFSEQEEYEKCDHIQKCYNKILDHEKNYLKE